MVNVLEADSIRKSFGNKEILTDIFIRCNTGDVIGLLGRNGTGKSTLLKIIFGSLDTDYKHISINGEIMNQPFHKKGTIVFLSQDNFLPKRLTVRKAIDLFDHRIDINRVIEEDIISKIYNSRINEISGGELRYLEISIILNLETKFVLLDEPFNGLSPLQIDRVKNKISAQSAHKGIILTDHDYRNVLDVANKYMILYDGGLKTIKSREDLITWGYIPDDSDSNSLTEDLNILSGRAAKYL